ncbi:hypothetical protein HRbin38_00162 [bacterium HR38]|uniref:ABC transporter permease n=1 Tax=Thermus sp. NMX2.A1 TaxID=570924 RepID=UPI0003DC27BC|nr:ABC transporter permease [Thermus sp. NMX2.A1]ETN87667.1 hypothetical protein TNMX_10895 [Thermus sp. NMX2.A1]GBD40307.1 hypothetical protein HRbin38_00162 [bacterium HR38]
MASHLAVLGFHLKEAWRGWPGMALYLGYTLIVYVVLFSLWGSLEAPPWVLGYLWAAEALYMGIPRFWGQLHQEAQRGELGLRLALPYPFVFLRFQRYLATALLQIPLVAAVGGAVIGALGLSASLSLWSLPALALGLILNFLLELTFALLTFRSTSPMALGVLLEMLRLLGGAVVLPLEFWPEGGALLLQPLAATFYLPARVAAGGEPVWLLVSLCWILVFLGLLARLFPRALAALSERGEV